MGIPASIKVHLAITILFTILTVTGLVLILLGMTDTYTLAEDLLGRWRLIQLTLLAFICFVIYTVFTFNTLMLNLVGPQKQPEEAEAAGENTDAGSVP